MIKKNPALGGT